MAMARLPTERVFTRHAASTLRLMGPLVLCRPCVTDLSQNRKDRLPYEHIKTEAVKATFRSAINVDIPVCGRRFSLHIIFALLRGPYL